MEIEVKRNKVMNVIGNMIGKKGNKVMRIRVCKYEISKMMNTN